VLPKKGARAGPFPRFFMYDIDISLELGGSTCKGVMEVGLVGARCSRLPSLSDRVADVTPLLGIPELRLAARNRSPGVASREFERIFHRLLRWV
jgi:hypothetical protein